ncbi:VOC family protein [Paenarthrobacter sp. CM16]|uniref:VOC family protein n=1 Tax=Paenarthrobacter sp. CM16 TaxID=2738447 RepID=UPI001554765C|nr:VOC family protein [Paenarthrobacter sp. CM16]NQD87770.1 VOC family protein [Paenarthrobacter sp. CM16]
METVIQHHHTALHVADLERSARFYADGLGLRRLEEWTSGAYISELFGRPNVKVRALMLATDDGNFRLELVQVEEPPPAIDPSQAQPGTAHIAFTGIDVRRVFAHMAAFGYGALSEPVEPASGPNGGGLLIYLLDPDGNRVELIQPPGWQESAKS